MAHTKWPVKTREELTPIWDSSYWNGFEFRDDDVVVATYSKSGTTWTQQIVTQLIFDGSDASDIMGLAPWLDMRLQPIEEKLATLKAQTHRRQIKTHLPIDALVYSPRAKYVFVGRDGRDVAWSLHNHFHNFTDGFLALTRSLPGNENMPDIRPGPDPHAFYRQWIANELGIGGDFFAHIRGWWDARALPNILFVHYNDLKKDLRGEMERIARFLGIAPTRWDAIEEHCSFAYMKEHGSRLLPVAELAWEGGARTFINKGTNGRWRDMLSAEEIADYDARALAQLGPECAAWLAHGGHIS